MNKPRDMRFEQLTNELHEAEQHVSEERLDRAIRLGLELGRKQRRKVRRRWQIGGTAASMLAACLAVIILYNHTIWPGSATTAAPDSSQVPALDPGVKEAIFNIGDHSDWQTAYKNGLYQPVNQSKEDGKFKLTVNGVLADSSNLILFITGNNTLDKEKVSFFGFETTDEHGDPLVFKSGEDNDSNSSPNVANLVLHYVFDESHPVPDVIHFKAKLGLDNHPTNQSNFLEIPPIHIDPGKFTQTLYANQEQQIGDVRFTVTKAVLSPLSTKIYLSMDQNSAKKLKDFYHLQVYVGKGKDRREIRMPLNPDSSSKSKEPYIFTYKGSYFEYSQSPAFSIMANGIEQSLGDELQFKVDTKQQKLINSPDPRMHFGSVTENEKGTIVKLIFDETEFPIPTTKQYYNEDNAIHQFTDGQGQKHSLLDLQYRAYTSDPTASIEFTIPKGNYAQPLTFTLQNYPGLKIKKDFTVNFHP
ncbi:DUF4179 domain-containing protein [Paenibacillus sp. CAA11]|uniref:DUF4179 domain-containing protein n=1 Tax=Paenibacillus sp. CAA11 TaxID=1532905 RepID=UPI00131F017F|nr:DUF4179 domain-containing protein [Paenibacillus sp. CAA11]